MTTLNQDLKDKLRHLNVLEKIIGINVAIFLIGLLLSLVVKSGGSLYWLELPKDLGDFIFKPWSIITYGFTHYGFFHLLFNMMVLYFVSQMMLNLFSPKLTLNVYFLGIIMGGLFFFFAYNVFPADFLKPAGALVGASAGVRALLIFLCAYMPNTQVRMIFFNIKLWHLGIALVVFDIIGLFGLNQGGNIAHLGGVALGYFYAKQLIKGHDIGKGFEKIMDGFFNLFKPGKKSPLKTVHKRKSNSVAGHTKSEFKEFSKQKQIDIILDKISKSGYESLTEEEKAFLFKVKD
ncbi:membrane associated rhomboid family serine protease [Gelidibacter algens]|jgi:membrane associated rhomboid family serine protease|uniref:Membrane associated rhomboid family serine protease n=1 Tax=Gelidibacter algens TaxID=49280 RepID=A0A1A7R337_9FLAO|nr:rhomboid family intramembrane serine protease [Gelidibacter algens]OBX25918.1 rhomboid family intramembrane serine protease [Gelidibacter algens]RAJ25283.1 membrane associated rhomboid family serine protease [Gelidibacter algens]